MIDVKQAVKVAAEYLVDLYAPDAFSDVQLEEVELTEDENYWLITLSYKKPMTEVNLLGPIGIMADLAKNEKGYKIFKIEADTGKVVSMKIRIVEYA